MPIRATAQPVVIAVESTASTSARGLAQKRFIGKRIAGASGV
jgi:hypothetical protein